MQKLLSIILVFSFFSYQSYHSLVYLNYYVNQNYFATVLCENKDNPEKPGCNGKCHLKKQLEQQKPEQNTHPFSESTPLNFYPELFAVLISQITKKTSDYLNNSITCPTQLKLLSAHLLDIFHPPKSFFVGSSH